MLYFAYGSNLHANSVAEWCRHYGRRPPDLRGGKPTILDNHRLCFPVFSEYWGGGTADVVYDPGKYVAGATFELSDAEAATLDAKVRRRVCEDGGREVGVYKRVEVEVHPMGKGKPVRAYTYRGVEPEAYHIPPTQTYVDIIIQGAFEHGLSVMWISYLKSFGAQTARKPRPPRG